MSNSEKKVFRVHVIEPVYVGPVEPYGMFPPHEESLLGRDNEWNIVERDGDVYITHSNPRLVSDKTPLGERHTTRIPAANLRDVQYAPETIAPVAPTQPQLMKTKGAA